MRTACLLTCLFAIGCGGSNEEIAKLQKRVEQLESQLVETRLHERIKTLELESAGEVMEIIKPLIRDLVALKESLQIGAESVMTVRGLNVVDEHGETRIQMAVNAGGSQIWLADGYRKRILLTAWEPVDKLGDISGITFQKTGSQITWQTPSAR